MYIFFIEKMFNVNKVVGITTVIHILDTNSFSFSDELGRRGCRKKEGLIFQAASFPFEGNVIEL